MKRKPFWRSKKFWGIIVAATLRIFGSKMGIEPADAEAASNCFLVGVGAEGFADGLGALFGGKRDG